MKIKRNQISLIYEILKKFENNESYSINFKYKILKIKKVLEEESLLNLQLLKTFINKYGFITEEGEVYIKDEYKNEVQKQISDFNQQELELPDIYFTIEELSVTKIDWKSLEILMPLIKDE